MSIFQKLFKNKNAVKKDKAIAFVDYEHWYYSIQKNFGLKPEPVSWRRKLEEQYDLEDVMVFADFGHKGIDGELTKLRNMTNTIIETQQTFSRYKKDMTDFIMLDYIYQTAYTKPDITTFIIFTGDGHFQSVTKYLIQKLNKKVVIYGVRDSVSKQLRAVASECYMLPTDAETLRGYYEMIVSNLAYVSEKSNIIPTFNGTVSAVARHNEVPEELIHAALQEMLDKGLIYQRLQRVAFNKEVKVVAANWEELAKQGLWSFNIVLLRLLHFPILFHCFRSTLCLGNPFSKILKFHFCQIPFFIHTGVPRRHRNLHSASPPNPFYKMDFQIRLLLMEVLLSIPD